ncbi:hypothetical protein [Actinomadura hibisca]|uniref:hypothetical protein n=1 Tax=Actinomadura hibisca TaxID=68565 RepID=UPI000A04A470|nr:hypothetical protein [Actinomadura hibisca]
MITTSRRTLARSARALPLLLLPLGAAAACGGENTSTDCSVNSCTITFDRGVNASANILGAKVELVGVQGDTVNLRIGGQQVSVPLEAEQQADGFNVDVTSVTKENVVVKISHSG